MKIRRKLSLGAALVLLATGLNLDISQGVSVSNLGTVNSSDSFSVYIDAPFVQASYISELAGVTSYTDTYNGIHSWGAETESSCPTTGNVGTYSGGTTSQCSIMKGVSSYRFGGATTTNSDPSSNAGNVNKSDSLLVKNSTGLTITFTHLTNYLGFWWSAGSRGNSVEIWQDSIKVATISTDDVCRIVGSVELPRPNSPAANYYNCNKTSITVNTLGGGTHTYSNYYGHPADRSSILDPDEPFTYVHFFGQNGMTFNKVVFKTDANGFEFDNLTTAHVASDQFPTSSTKSGRLVAVGSYGVDSNGTIKTLTYNLNSGSSTVTSQQMVSGATTNLTTVLPTRTGYTFAGWLDTFTSSTYSSGATYPSSGTISTDKTLTAQWTGNTYTVTYEYNGATGSNSRSSDTYTAGGIHITPPTPTLSGKRFEGWSTANFGQGDIYYNSYNNSDDDSTRLDREIRPLNNITLYASWAVPVTYDGNGGTYTNGGTVSSSVVWNVQTAESGTAVAKPNFTDEVLGNIQSAENLLMDDCPLPAASGKAVPSCLNSFAPSYSRNNYSFVNWNTAADGSGTTYMDGGYFDFANPLTLFAQWVCSAINVTFDSQGGSSVPSGCTSNSENLTQPANPSKSGYNFNGWYRTPNGGTAITFPFSHGETSGFSLYAQWSPIANSGGGGGYSPPAIVAPILPGITWNPAPLKAGEPLTEHQLNAKFSVPGKVTYSIPLGTIMKSGIYTVKATFVPTDTERYLVVETTQQIVVLVGDNSQSISLDRKNSSGAAAVNLANPKSIDTKSLTQLGKIYFNNNEFFLDAGDRSKLKEIAATVVENKYKSVLVFGNTDIKKGVDNTWLSRSRAQAVAKYLKQFNLNVRYTQAWFGPTRPVSKGTDPLSLKLNRRVEIYLIK